MNETQAVVIGVDPGESVGVVALGYQRPDVSAPWQRLDQTRILQCHHETFPLLIKLLIEATPYNCLLFISHERYVVNLRAAKSKRADAGKITRYINGAISALPAYYSEMRLEIVEHTASQAKSWCIPERLKAAGLLLTPKMIHAQDAGAQALFAATYDLGAPDPLSKRAALQAAPATADVTHHPDGVTINSPGLYQFGTVDAGAPGTETTVTFDSSGGVYEVMRRVVDSQAADQARYIGLERHDNEQH